MSRPYYTKKDRVGEKPSCACARTDQWCDACLIAVGADHHERTLYVSALPVMADVFDTVCGLWLRGIVDVRANVCFTCYWDFAEGLYEPTVRLAPVEPDARRARTLAWHEQHALPAPRKRHVGSFLRVPRLEDSDHAGHVARLGRRAAGFEYPPREPGYRHRAAA